MSTKKGTLPHIQEMADIAIAAMTEPFHTAGSDEWIETTFRESYVYRVYLRDDGIKVRAKNGIITLTGTVSQEAHKALAEDTASAIAGVIHVNNYLQNSPEDDGEDADAWITRLIKMNLLLHRHVSSARTVVEVKDGTVTLKGEAASPAQKELTGEYAADIEGVREGDQQHDRRRTRTAGGPDDRAGNRRRVDHCPGDAGAAAPPLNQRIEDVGHHTEWRGETYRRRDEPRREGPGDETRLRHPRRITGEERNDDRTTPQRRLTPDRSPPRLRRDAVPPAGEWKRQPAEVCLGALHSLTSNLRAPISWARVTSGASNAEPRRRFLRRPDGA